MFVLLEEQKFEVGQVISHTLDGEIYRIRSVQDNTVKACLLGYDNPQYTFEKSKVRIKSI